MIHPRDAKEILARAIVAQFHGAEAADRAAESFRRQSAGLDPLSIPDVPLDALGPTPLPRLLVALGLERSTSAARRVIEQGGVTLGPDRRPATDPKAVVDAVDGLIVRVGRRKVVRVRPAADAPPGPQE